MLKILYNAGTKTANVCSSTARVCWGAQPIPRNHRCPGRVLITCALEARSPWRRGGALNTVALHTRFGAVRIPHTALIVRRRCAG